MKQQAWNRYLPLALFAAFTFTALVVFFQSRPSSKNKRIYKIVQHYSPYYLEKRFGGLTIKHKKNKAFKEKPTNMSLFKEFERLEKEWGKHHLKIDGDTLLIIDDNSSIKAKFRIEKIEELNFIHQYYEI
ncbi:MAG: hypothetical protein LGB54_00735 [Sulfurovum sp.]|nr:hypothetical protein [Sulfurovum sp.]MCB4759295.1 hypothetical protein [Sulfurovum sp.]